jgi:hypothetical protein
MLSNNRNKIPILLDEDTTSGVDVKQYHNIIVIFLDVRCPERTSDVKQDECLSPDMLVD